MSDNKHICVRLLGIGLIATMTPGCSFLFVTPPPDHAASYGTFQCTTSQAAPIVDSLVTGAEVVRTVIAAVADESAYRDAPIGRGADIALGVGFTALFLSSAVYGFGNTASCRKAKHMVPSEPRRTVQPQENTEKWSAPPAAPPARTPAAVPATEAPAPSAVPPAPSGPEPQVPAARAVPALPPTSRTKS